MEPYGDRGRCVAHLGGLGVAVSLHVEEQHHRLGGALSLGHGEHLPYQLRGEGEGGVVWCGAVWCGVVWGWEERGGGEEGGARWGAEQ